MCVCVCVCCRPSLTQFCVCVCVRRVCTCSIWQTVVQIQGRVCVFVCVCPSVPQRLTFALGVDAALRRVEVLHEVPRDLPRGVRHIAHLHRAARQLQQRRRVVHQVLHEPHLQQEHQSVLIHAPRVAMVEEARGTGLFFFYKSFTLCSGCKFIATRTL